MGSGCCWPAGRERRIPPWAVGLLATVSMVAAAVPGGLASVLDPSVTLRSE